MAWTTPSLRSAGYKVRALDWNNELVENMNMLALHEHSGVAGDGAAIAVPELVNYQSIFNTVAATPLFPDIQVAGGSLGAKGNFYGELYLLLTNTSGAGKNYSWILTYGGQTTTLTTGRNSSGANTKSLLILEFGLFGSGAVNTQETFLAARYQSAAALADASGAFAAPDGVWDAMTVDSTLLQTLSLTVTMSAALGTVGVEVLGGSYFGVNFGS